MHIKYRNEIRQGMRRRLYKAFSLVIIAGFSIAVATVVTTNLPVWLIKFTEITQPQTRVLAAAYTSTLTPATTANIKDSVTSSANLMDFRAYVFNEYFRANNSPLYGTGEIFVRYCDRYAAPRDCIMTVAIARAETDLCKYHNSASYYNCWGYGGGPGHRIYFNSWEQSIERVTRALAQAYGYEYMIDPRKMERRFCGLEPGCTGWGKRVIFHMDNINDFSIQLGFGSLYALRTS